MDSLDNGLNNNLDGNSLDRVDIGDGIGELEAHCGEGSLLLGPVAEKPVLTSQAVGVVSALASVARNCLLSSADSGIISNMDAVIQVLQGSTATEEPMQSEGGPQGRVVLLAMMARRCQKAEVVEACVQLNYWLNVLTFACQMNQCVALGQIFASSQPHCSFREMITTKESKYTIFKRIVAEFKHSDAEQGIKQPRTLNRYFEDGLKTAALCCAGSFYMLIFMACSQMHADLRKLNGPMCGRIAKLIRYPPGRHVICHLHILLNLLPDTAVGRKVTKYIIPAVALLWQQYTISLHVILPLDSLGLGHLAGTIDCQDICSSDTVLDGLFYK